MLKVNNLKICSLFLMFVLFQISVYSEMFTNMTATSEKLATISSPTINKLVVSPDGKRIAYPYNIDGLWYIGGNVDNLVPHAVDRIIPESIKFGEDSQTVAYVVEIDDRYSMCMKNGITQQFDELYLDNIIKSTYVAFKSKINGKIYNSGVSINDNKAYVPKLFYDDIYLIDQLWYFVKVNDKWALRYGYDIDKNYTVFETLHDKIDDVYISNIMNRDEKLMCYKSIDNGMESIFLMKIGKFDNVKYLSEQIVPYVKKILCVAIDSKYNMAYAYLDDNGKLNLKTGTIENAWKSKDMGKGFDQGTVYYLIPDIKEKNFLRVGSSLMDYRSAEKVVIQKELVDTCDGISNMLWGDKGRKLAIKAKFGNKYAVLINNDKGPLYDDIGEIIFSPDGKHFSYSAKSGDKWFVVVDGKIGQNFSEAVNLVYNKESTCLVYMVKHNESDDKYGSSKYKPNDLWGVVINDYHSTDVYVNKFFTKPIFDNEKELHFISGKYLTTTAQEKRQEYAVELNNCKIEMIEIKENEPVKPENKIQ